MSAQPSTLDTAEGPDRFPKRQSITTSELRRGRTAEHRRRRPERATAEDAPRAGGTAVSAEDCQPVAAARSTAGTVRIVIPSGRPKAGLPRQLAQPLPRRVERGVDVVERLADLVRALQRRHGLVVLDALILVDVGTLAKEGCGSERASNRTTAETRGVWSICSGKRAGRVRVGPRKVPLEPRPHGCNTFVEGVAERFAEAVAQPDVEPDAEPSAARRVMPSAN